MRYEATRSSPRPTILKERLQAVDWTAREAVRRTTSPRIGYAAALTPQQPRTDRPRHGGAMIHQAARDVLVSAKQQAPTWNRACW
jgi:hypothetical protein